MFEEIIKIEGDKTGPTSIVLAGVHGNEQCGVKAMQKTLAYTKIERGIVLFGYGNPRAIEQNKRYTEANLNRLFQDDSKLSDEQRASYEYQRAQYLKKYLNKANALLDLHASETKKSKPFAICEANANDIVKYLPVDIIVSGFDDVEPGGTDYYMNKQGKIGICLECGYRDDTQAIDIAQKGIITFLQAQGHIVNNINPKQATRIQIQTLYKTKTNNFTLSKNFYDFEYITKHQLIGSDGNKKIYAQDDGIILFARDRTKCGDEAFLLGKEIKDSPT